MPQSLLLDVIRAGPPNVARCRATECRRLIEWVTVVSSGKLLPVDHPLLVEDVHEREDGRVVTTIQASRTHWATCPASSSFKRQPKGRVTAPAGRLFGE